MPSAETSQTFMCAGEERRVARPVESADFWRSASGEPGEDPGARWNPSVRRCGRAARTAPPPDHRTCRAWRIRDRTSGRSVRTARESRRDHDASGKACRPRPASDNVEPAERHDTPGPSRARLPDARGSRPAARAPRALPPGAVTRPQPAPEAVGGKASSLCSLTKCLEPAQTGHIAREGTACAGGPAADARRVTRPYAGVRSFGSRSHTRPFLAAVMNAAMPFAPSTVTTPGSDSIPAR